MAKLQRKSAKVFAQSASAGVGGISQFGSLAEGNINYSKDPDVIQALDAYKNGWSSAVVGNKSPAIEDRNALDYLLSYQQAYIMQRGIPEWLDTETYYQGSFASKADSKLYVSKVDNNIGHDPELDTTETYWLKFPTPQEVAAKVSKSGDTMTGDLTIQKNSPQITITNTSTSPQVPAHLLQNILGDVLLSATNSVKGLMLNSQDNFRPYVMELGTSTKYRVLDTRDVNSGVAVGYPDLTAGVSISSGYVTAKNGWIKISTRCVRGTSAHMYFDGVVVWTHSAFGDNDDVNTGFYPIKQGQVVTVDGEVVTLEFYPMTN